MNKDENLTILIERYPILQPGKCAIVAYEQGDLAQEAEAVAQLAGMPIRCESCGCDVRRYPSVGFGRVRLIAEDGIDSNLGWFRLCEKCYCRANAEDDPLQASLAEDSRPYKPHFFFLARLWPGEQAEAYKDGYLRFKGEMKS